MAKEPKAAAVITADANIEDTGDAPGVLTTAVVAVKGPAKGRWRIGRHFGAEEVLIPEDELSADQKAALAADPELMVRLIENS